MFHVTGFVAKTASESGELKDAIVIRPRDPVRLRGTNLVLYREYQITNGAGSPIVLRCLSAEGSTRAEPKEVTVEAITSHPLKTVPGAKTKKVDTLILGLVLEVYSPKGRGQTQ